MSQLKAGDVFAGRYRVLKYSGAGSFGGSYVCEDFEKNNSPVFLKILDQKFSSTFGFMDAYSSTLKSLTQIHLSNVVKPNHLDSFSDVWYTTSEYINGSNLKTWLQNALSFEERVITGLELLKRMSQMLSELHELGYSACLKPQNIILSEKNIYLTDFWVAGLIPLPEFEQNQAARQYLPYMAPEVKDNWKNLSHLSDYYSLGALLYEIFVGKSPIGNFKKPSECSKLYNHAVDSIVIKFLATNPSLRPQNIHELNEDINILLSSFIPSRSAVASSTSKIETQTSTLESNSSLQSEAQTPQSSSDPGSELEDTSKIFELEDDEASPSGYQEKWDSEEYYPDEDSETLMISKDDLEEITEMSSAGESWDDDEPETRAIPLSEIPNSSDTMIDTGIEDEDLEDAFDRWGDDDSDEPEVNVSEEPVIDFTEESGENKEIDDVIAEEITPPRNNFVEEPQPSNTEQADVIVNDEDEPASINHFGDTHEAPVQNISEFESITQQDEPQPVISNPEEDVKVVESEETLGDSIPSRSRSKPKSKPQENRIKGVAALEEDDPPPAPLAVKILLVILGLGIIGGSIYLGLNYQFPWK